MLKKLFLSLIVLSAIFFVFQSNAHAQKEQRFKHANPNKKVNTWWEKRADTDGNDVVDSDELSAWKKLEKERIDLNNDGIIDAKEKRLCWRHARSRVNTPLEEKYDKNADGWLEAEEVKELLKDKRTLIKTHGQAKVDTDIEREYDTNGDGILDAGESEVLKEDIQ
ncbi:MAG: hypothetical protein ABIH40_06305 [Candidatus Omnitrophota bacterium]